LYFTSKGEFKHLKAYLFFPAVSIGLIKAAIFPCTRVH